MSVAILLAEATLLPSGVDLSLFSILVKSVGKQEVLVQVAAFVPLMYMCICTYYSLFQIGMLMFYSLTPRQTSSLSLLMICSLVARYEPPISYNFLNLIRLGGNVRTTFEKVQSFEVPAKRYLGGSLGCRSSGGKGGALRRRDTLGGARAVGVLARRRLRRSAGLRI